MILVLCGRYSQVQRRLVKKQLKICKKFSPRGRSVKATVRPDQTSASQALIMMQGLTETCTVVCSSSPTDIWFGSSGILLPGVEIKLITPEGKEVTEYNTPGELCVKSPSVVLGYLNNDKANAETFIDGYMHTGDEAVIKKSKLGNEHVFIVDRIKELIKVMVCSLFLAIARIY